MTQDAPAIALFCGKLQRHIVAGLLLLVLSPAHADDSRPVEITLPAVTTVGHYDNGVGTSDAASQGTVRGELLQNEPLLRPGEVLESVPGLVVTQHSGDGKANQYFLRGYNLDHGTDFAIHVDGVPVNMPTNAHGQGYADLNFLIPELVQRIDYRKGPYYAENGDFSAAGSADIHYRNTLEKNFATLTLGTYDYRRALLALANTPEQARKGSAFLGAFEYQEENGPWTNPEDLHKYNALLRLSDGNRQNGWSVDGNIYSAQWNSTDQVPQALINSGQLGRFSTLDPTDGGNSGRNIVSGEWHAHSAKGYSKAQLYLEHYSMALWSDFSYFMIDPIHGDQFSQQEMRNIAGGQLVHGWNNSVFGADSNTEVGLQVRYDHNHVGLWHTADRIDIGTVSDDLVNETEIGTYVQNTSIWSPWLRSLAGLRFDQLILGVTSHHLPADSQRASGEKISPKLSLIFGPWANTEYFFNAGRGFHSNDARGVTERVDATTQQAVSAIPALVAATGAEVGVKTEAIRGWQSALTLWRLDSDSELIYSADFDLGNTQANGASKRWGVEWNNHLLAQPWLLLDVDLAWTQAHYASANANGQSGDNIPNAVSKVAVLGLTAQNLGPWSAASELRYIGSCPLTQNASMRQPASAVTNVRLQRSFGSRISLAADVLNVFNREYDDIAYAQQYALKGQETVDGITVHPGEPRELRLSLRAQF